VGIIVQIRLTKVIVINYILVLFLPCTKSLNLQQQSIYSVILILLHVLPKIVALLMASRGRPRGFGAAFRGKRKAHISSEEGPSAPHRVDEASLMEQLRATPGAGPIFIASPLASMPPPEASMPPPEARASTPDGRQRGGSSSSGPAAPLSGDSRRHPGPSRHFGHSGWYADDESPVSDARTRAAFSDAAPASGSPSGPAAAPASGGPSGPAAAPEGSAGASQRSGTILNLYFHKIFCHLLVFLIN
jgi:hypothetical protein